MKKRTKKAKNIKVQENEFAAAMLVVVALFAGMVYAQAPQEWRGAAAETLNLSAQVQASIADVNQMAQPMVQAATDINTFYQLAADEMMEILNIPLFPEELSFLLDGINEFYAQAAVEMAELLDMSGQIAGASVSR